MYASGPCGGSGNFNDVTWTLDNNGTLTISGTGEMGLSIYYPPSYNHYNSYKNAIKSVIIENGVTNIPQSAFSGCSNLTSVVISDSVTDISYWAFDGCSSLTSVVIPNSVTQLNDWAFENCSSLTSVVIPDSVTQLGKYVFKGCSSLTSVVISNGVTKINYQAFKDCSSLTNISIPNSVTQIGEQAFEGCSSLTTISIPDSVTQIGEHAFKDCSSLTNISIPAGVTSFLMASFFEGCSSLTNISVDENNQIYNSIDGVLYRIGYDGEVLIAYPAGKTDTTYIIGNDDTECVGIWSNAFSYCTNLEKVIFLPNYIYFDYQAFSYCTNLKEVIILSEIEDFDDEDDFDDDFDDNFDDEFDDNFDDDFDDELNDIFYKCSPDLVIKGYSGSSAETFANKHGYTFVAISEADIYPTGNPTTQPTTNPSIQPTVKPTATPTPEPIVPTETKVPVCSDFEEKISAEFKVDENGNAELKVEKKQQREEIQPDAYLAYFDSNGIISGIKVLTPNQNGDYSFKIDNGNYKIMLWNGLDPITQAIHQ